MTDKKDKKEINDIKEIEKLSNIRETVHDFANNTSDDDYIYLLLKVVKTSFPKEKFRNVLEKIERIFTEELSSLNDDTLDNFTNLLKIEAVDYKLKEYKKLESEFKTLKLLDGNKCEKDDKKNIDIENELDTIISKLVKLKLVDVHNGEGICKYPLLNDIFEYKLSKVDLHRNIYDQIGCDKFIEIMMKWYSYVSDFPSWTSPKLNWIARFGWWNGENNACNIIITLYNNCHNLKVYVLYDKHPELYEKIRDKDVDVYNRLRNDNNY
jgi:hypothetical protein